MKKLPVLLVIMSLIVGSLFSAIHSHASDFSDSTVTVIKSIDDHSDDHSDSHLAECDQCCHACSHVAMSNQTITYQISVSSKHLVSNSESYLSQLNSPPFQPPKT